MDSRSRASRSLASAFRPDGDRARRVGRLASCSVSFRRRATRSISRRRWSACRSVLRFCSRGLSPTHGANAQPALVAATIVVLAMVAPRLVQHLGTVIHPERWTVMRVHADGVAMAERLAAAGVSGKVATLSPVYPLEGGLAVYPELATGPFAYRTADITPPDIAAFYRMTSPTRVAALFDADPPAALLLGFDAALEEPMLAYAKKERICAGAGFCDRRPLRHRNLVHQASELGRLTARPLTASRSLRPIARKRPAWSNALRDRRAGMLPVSAAMAGRLRRAEVPRQAGPTSAAGTSKPALSPRNISAGPQGQSKAIVSHPGRQRLQQDVRKPFESRAQYENVSGGKPVAWRLCDARHPNTIGDPEVCAPAARATFAPILRRK